MSEMEAVKATAIAWQYQPNDQQIGIDWRFTAQDARIKLKRLYPIIKVQKST
jgi:hypothetical protein